jgi:hypothetical protein
VERWWVGKGGLGLVYVVVSVVGQQYLEVYLVVTASGREWEVFARAAEVEIPAFASASEWALWLSVVVTVDLSVVIQEGCVAVGFGHPGRR